MRVMTSMLLLLKQYFFNPQNKTPIYIQEERMYLFFFMKSHLIVFIRILVLAVWAEMQKIKYILLKLKVLWDG